ncbi:hypothetical protein [Pseudomonas aeruginosa]|uniref:hypothetical protein n=1 Tax=Pseudomonas aeruginosa TaxID=287 RepID=UPI0028FEF604|nr:hypothetical protein [Pseudomonas aeruginosa]MDU0542824.1 hypothetical protein [Pseudomonas aeruginosa]
MSIDWNTAPDGATHWEPRGTVFGEGWMKKAGNEWSYWLEGSEVWAGVWADCFVSAEREATFEARPQDTWDGQGLPPVGIQIEAKFPVTDVTGTHYHWRRVIVAVAGIPRAERECLVYDAENTKPAWVDEFRPLRTPEQVAAAERWAAIQQMLAFADVKYGAGELMSPKEYVETAVAALYDAGYRRQESST